MIPQTASMDEWHGKDHRVGVNEGVIPSKETIELLKRLPFELRGYRMQPKTLDLWVDSTTLDMKTLREIESLGLTVQHIVSFIMPADDVVPFQHVAQCIATHKNGASFGTALAEV